MAARGVRYSAPGHKVTIEWSGETGAESSSTATCKCGWTESASSQKECWFEYHQHIIDVWKKTGDPRGVLLGV